MSWNIRRNPFFPDRVERHDGIDLPYGMNEMINAKQDGVIKRISNDPNGYGNFVDILHDDGTSGRYAHAGIISRGEGQRVRRGEEIGLAGSTGRSTGPHLHFEHLDQNNRPMDPRPLLASVGGRAPTQFASNSQAAPTQTASAAPAAPTQNYGGPNMSTSLPLTTGRPFQGVEEYVAEGNRLLPQATPSPELTELMTQNLRRRSSNLPLALGAMLSRDQGVQKFGGAMYDDANDAQNPQALGDEGFFDPQTGKFVASPIGENRRKQKILEMSINALNRNKTPDPYFTPIMTTNGVASFDNRRGTTQIATGPDGQPIIPFVADPKGQGDVAGAKEGAKIKGAFDANQIVDAPKEIRNGEYAIGLIDKIISHPGRQQATGFSRLAQIQHIPGTAAKDFDILLKQIQGKQFLEAFESLKGGGAITQIEGEKATQAIARMDAAGSETEFLAAAKEFQTIVREGVKRARGVQGRSGQTQQPQTGAPDSNSPLTAQEQAELAELRGQGAK